MQSDLATSAAAAAAAAATHAQSQHLTESLISKNATMINEILHSVKLAKAKESFIANTPDAKRIWKPMSNQNTPLAMISPLTKPTDPSKIISKHASSSSLDQKQPALQHQQLTSNRSFAFSQSNLPSIIKPQMQSSEKPHKSLASLFIEDDADPQDQTYARVNTQLSSPSSISQPQVFYKASHKAGISSSSRTPYIKQFSSQSSISMPSPAGEFLPNRKLPQNPSKAIALSPDQMQLTQSKLTAEFTTTLKPETPQQKRSSFLQKSSKSSLSYLTVPFAGASTTTTSNFTQSRDISHIQESAASTQRQPSAAQIKQEQSMHILLSPMNSKRPSLFNSRNASLPRIKTKSQLHPSDSTQSTVTQSNPASNTSSLYGFAQFFPTSFLEEFIEIIKETNLSNSHSTSSMTHLDSFTTNTKSSAPSSSMSIHFNQQVVGSNSAAILRSIHSEIQQILLNQSVKPGQQTNTSIGQSTLAELAYSLKRSHPNLFSGQPSGRAEVLVVQNWLESTLENVIWDKAQSIQERFQRIDDALTLTFNELARQVSYQCRERGMLLLSVFSCYFGLVKKVSVFEQEEKVRVSIENDYQKLLMQKNADADVDSKQQEIKALEQLLQIEKMNVERLKGELEASEAREKAQFNKGEKLKAINDQAKVQLFKMKKEIEDLHSRLSTKEFFEKKKLEKALKEYKSTLQRQLSSVSMSTSKAFETFETADEKLLANLTVNEKKAIETLGDERDEVLQLSFDEIIKDAASAAPLPQTDVFIRQVADEKVEAMICMEVQTDPMMTLTFNKSIKVQTDLDFIDRKFDRVFASKAKVEEFIREQQIKADLLQLEEYAGESALNTSLDQEISLNEDSIRPDKPMLSNLFLGLPIKQLKKKIPKNNLEKFVENMGVLYQFLNTPTEGENAQVASTSVMNQANAMPAHSLRNLIVSNLKKEEAAAAAAAVTNPHMIQSMKEIQEVDELQEEHDRGHTPLPPARQLLTEEDQARQVEFRRSPKKGGSIIGLARQKTIALAALANKNADERQQIKELYKQIQLDHRVLVSLEKVSSEPPSVQDVLEIVMKQKTLIDKFNNMMFTGSDSQINDPAGSLSSIPDHQHPPIIEQPAASVKTPKNNNMASLSNIMTTVNNVAKKHLSKRQQSIPLEAGNSTSVAAAAAAAIVKKSVNFAHPTTPKKHEGSNRDTPIQSKMGSQSEIPSNISTIHHAQSSHNIINHSTSKTFADMDTVSAKESNNSFVQELQQDASSSLSPADLEVKQQIVGLVQLYNMEIEKNSNLRESLEELIKLLRELYHFSKSLFIHIKKTQKHTHKSIIEGFIQTFTSLKWKLPKEFDKNFEQEILKEEKEDANKKLSRLRFSNKKSTQRFLAHVQKSQAFTKMTLVDKSQHFGFIVANRIREQGIPKKYASFLPLKNTLKYIQNLVDERVRMIRERRLPPDQDMPIFTFNKFLQIFGFRRVAENKYAQFLMSVMHYQSIFRVNLFARLLTLINDKKLNFTTDEMEKYFSAYEFIINLSTMGVVNPQHSETDANLNVALLKALDYVKVVLEKIMPAEDTQELRLVLDSMKEVDLKSANKILMVDFDMFMNKVLQKYRLLMNRTQLFVKNAFFAADLDGNERINLNEFLTLYRHIMPTKFNLMKCIKLFEEKADIITEDQKNLSFEKFTALCIDHSLFTTQMQDKYIQVSNKEDIARQLFTLKSSWAEQHAKLLAKIDILKPFVVPQSHENWIEVGIVLDQRLHSDDLSEENYRPLLIAHRLLNDELDRLIAEGQKGSEEAEDGDDDDDDDDNYDDDIYKFQDEDDTEIQSILKTMNPTQSQAKGNLVNTTIGQITSATELNQKHLDESSLKITHHISSSK